MMKSLKHIVVFISLLLLEATALKAQFTEIDWTLFAGDTLLPRHSVMIELPDDYHMYNYTAAVEYPEFAPLSDSEIAQYRLESMRDSILSYPKATVVVGVSAKQGQLDVSFVPIVYFDGKFQRINSYKLVVNRTLDMRKSLSSIATRAASANRYAENSVLNNGRWVKIAVQNSGVYKITSAQLSKMGFKDISKVRLFGYGGHIIPEKNIHLQTDDLCEIPVWRENDYLLFYANGTILWEYSVGRFIHRQNVYSNYSYYFLNEGDTPPISFPKENLEATSSSVYTTYPDYVLHEKEEKSMSTYGRILLDAYDYSSGRNVSYKFNIEGVATENAIIDVSFGTNATSRSTVGVTVNNVSAGSMTISEALGTEHGRISQTTFNVQSGFTDNPTIKLSHNVQDNSLNGHLDYIRINFTRTLALRGSFSNFRGSDSKGNAMYKIASATNSTHVWKVTKASEITELTSSFSDGTLSVIAPASRSEELVAVDVKGNFPTVTVIGEVRNQNLHGMEQTDMVIIVPANGDFIEPAERLAQKHRMHDGITVAVITADQVYNEFSSGTPDATAYRRLMKMLYDRATTAKEAPKYLLLFGDGLTDNRMITYSRRNQDDYLLTYQSENSVSATRSYVLEDYFSFLDDDEGANFLRDKADIAVGRIPAQTITEANAVVDKLIAYMNNDVAGTWQNVILLMGDDGDNNSHMEDAEEIAKIIENIPSAYMIERIYWDDYPMEVQATGDSYPMVTDAIYKCLNEGALIANYSGHGSANLFSHEQVWKASDMAALTSPHIPFWVTASCDITPFDMGDNSIGEQALLNPKGAAIGLLTTTRTVLQSYNGVINRQFMRHLMTQNPDGTLKSVGDAMRLAKCDIISSGSDVSENKLQFILIGDPALRLNMPQYKIVVESFNGKPAEQQGKVSAGGTVIVEGYIAKADGTPANDFVGRISPTLFDSKEYIYTRNNKSLEVGAFDYTAYRKKLFAGSDSIVNGRFSLTLPVPLDISYSDNQGMLNLFAVDTLGYSAQGAYNNFIVGGTASSNLNDGIGPQITMYLNTPEFIDGDEVNVTPRLYVNLFDENGINTVGTGIGHDIMAIIDNSSDYTYNLNNLFVPAVGDYRYGTVELSIDELPEGEHTLLLRAWDLFNNSSTDTLYFTVTPNLAPDLVDITVSPNPVRYGEQTYFYIKHNQPYSELDITLELFNFQGQILWKHSERAISNGAVHTVAWDVTSSGGSPIPTGVYMYRATLSSRDSSERTKTRKIIILNNK